MQKEKSAVGHFMQLALLGMSAVLLSACYVAPYPPGPPVAPAPAYYPGPYSYYEYPPYPGYVYGGPSVGFVFGGDGDHYDHHWH